MVNAVILDLREKIQKIRGYLRFIFLILFRDPKRAVHQVIVSQKTKKLFLEHPLDTNSIVFDVGGYMGEWSYQIAKWYDPHIFVFEPVPAFYQAACKRFQSNSKVKLWNLGLSDKNEHLNINVATYRSSIYGDGKNHIEIELRDIAEIIRESGVSQIDLMSINIEGGEYLLLDRMIETGIVEKCLNIQIQFHKIAPDSPARRLAICETLKKTHYPTYEFPFTWENWRRKNS